MVPKHTTETQRFVQTIVPARLPRYDQNIHTIIPHPPQVPQYRASEAPKTSTPDPLWIANCPRDSNRH